MAVKVPVVLLTRETLKNLGSYLTCGSPHISEDASILFDFLTEQGVCPVRGTFTWEWRETLFSPYEESVSTNVLRFLDTLRIFDGQHLLPEPAYQLVWILGPYL